ncbi:MAG: ABC transporter permease [bacterium]|nr:ABC transporter permease [bacterium]
MRKNYGKLYTAPVLLWLTVFFVIPGLIIVVFSFLKKGLYGGVVWKFSMEAYRALFQPAFLKVVLVTVYISVVSTFLTLLLSIPVAYFIARSKAKNILLLLIIIPFWTNFLIRIFAWIAILGNNGFLNHFFISIGLFPDYIQLLYNQYAVILVTVYTNLPYAILPLYVNVEKFDFSLLEAARDLGATKSQAIFRIFLPNIKVGIITAIIFTFIPALGSYAIPQLVGGADSYMVGNIIARELTINRNWPLASSMSVILTLVTTVAILFFVNMKPGRTMTRTAVQAKAKV